MKIKKGTLKKILIWILSIVAFIQMHPYFVWETYNNGLLSLLTPISIIFSIVSILLFVFMHEIRINTSVISIVIFFSLIWVYMETIGLDNTFSLHIGSFLILSVLNIFFILKEKDRKKIFNIFAMIFAISLILGIVVVVLSNIGINIPWEYLEAEHAGKAASGAFYKKYVGSAFIYFPGSNFSRLSAVYDEPGVVGTFAALFLIADDLRFKGRVRNIIILIGGILSFSMAFYIMVIIGIAIKSFNKGFLKFSITLIILIISFWGIISINTDNIIINKFQKRFEFVDGSLAGNNRETESFDYAFNEFIHGDPVKIIFGYGKDASSKNPLMSSSSTYKILIYDFGIIGFIMIIIWILYSNLKLVGFNKICMPLLVVFIISIYQRPFVFNIPYMFLLFGGYENLKSITNFNDKDIK